MALYSQTRSQSNPLDFLEAIKKDPELGERIVGSRLIPPRAATYQDPLSPLPPPLASHLEKTGIKKLYSHQAQALDLLKEGHNLTVVTPTASGKTLTYLLPVLTRLLKEPEAKALFLFPIKALAQDQLGVVEGWLETLNSNGLNGEGRGAKGEKKEAEGRRPKAEGHDL